MKKKASIIITGVALAAVVAAGASTPNDTAIPTHLRLRSTPEKVLTHEVKGSEVEYAYVSNDESPDEYYFAEGSHYSGAKILNKTAIKVAGKTLEQFQVSYNGDKVFKDDSSHKLLRIYEHATTSVSAWDQQTKKTLLQKFVSFLAPPSVYAVTDTFTSSSSWVAPAGVTSVNVDVWAGGGAGGQGNLTIRGGGGGGGGAYSGKTAYTVTPGNSYTVTVGAGGTSGGATGNPGDDSWFDSTAVVLAKGGQGGVITTGGAGGGAGGLASGGVGDTKFSGGNGSAESNGTCSGSGGGGAGTTQNGSVGGVCTGGAGGSSFGGAGGDGVGLNSGGGNGGNLRSGGGAGGEFAGGSNGPGGTGARGEVRVTYTLPATASGSAQDAVSFDE